MRPSRTAAPRLPARAVAARALAGPQSAAPHLGPGRGGHGRGRADPVPGRARPLLAVFAWHWADSAALRVQQRQRSSWHEVSAVVLASPRPIVDIGYGGVTGSEVLARWTAPDGTARTGDVTAPASAQVGSTVRIWVNQSGGATGPPLRAEQATGQAVLAGVLALFALAAVLVCAVALAVHVLDRRRLESWAADWRATGPSWNSHR